MFEKRTPCTYRKSSIMVVSAATLAFSLGINSAANAVDVLINDHAGLTGISQAVIDDLLDDEIADNVYILNSNIDLSPVVVSEDVFTYISGTFRGIFDGNGYNISNLSAPLFDVIGNGIETSEVKNVGLSTTANGITGDAGGNRVGILAGLLASNSSVSSVAVSGAISTVASDIAGGLVGEAGWESNISNSSTSVTITTAGQVDEYETPIQGIAGGLVGYGYGVVIENSTSAGSVTSTSGYAVVGGLIGDAVVSTILNSSSSVNVSIGGDDQTGGYVGGLVGDMDYGTVENSSASGAVNAISGSSGTGGLVGRFWGEIINSSASGPVSSVTEAVGGLVGWGYGSISHSSATGSVSVNSGAESIGAVGGLVGVSFVDIQSSYASGPVTVESESSINCVGGLVGCGYGVFDSSADGSVTVTSVNSSATDIGGLVGSTYGESVLRSSATGHVTVTGNESSRIGGLVGSAGDILDSFATGKVLMVGDAEMVGGLAGSANNITNSSATGDVTAENGINVGGLVGDGNNVTNSEASGAIIGESEVGLLAGFLGYEILNSIYTPDLDAQQLSAHGGITIFDNPEALGLSGPIGPELTPGADLPSGADLLNIDNDPVVWGENSYVNYGLPYILTLRAYGFYHESFPSASVVAVPVAVAPVNLNPKYSEEVSTILRLWLYLAGDDSIRITVSDFTVLGVAGVNKANLPILLKLLKGVDLITLDVSTIKKNVKIADELLKKTKTK